MGVEVLAPGRQLGVIGFDAVDRFHDVSAVPQFSSVPAIVREKRHLAKRRALKAVMRSVDRWCRG
jgi:hypothetical protein